MRANRSASLAALAATLALTLSPPAVSAGGISCLGRCGTSYVVVPPHQWGSGSACCAVQPTWSTFSYQYWVAPALTTPGFVGWTYPSYPIYPSTWTWFSVVVP